MAYTDGSVLLSHGGVEMGQGLHTKMLQVASHELGIPISKLHSQFTSTETVPNTMGTVGSTGTDLNGAAVIDACRKLNKQLEPYKQKMPDKSWDDWVKAANYDCVSLTAFGFFGNYDDPIDYQLATKSGKRVEYITYGAGCIEVEVNCHTGDTTILSADIVIDVGQSLNPAIDVGQIEGAFIQGLGYVTTEQLLISPITGALLNTGPSDYKVPTVADVPKNFNVQLLKYKPGYTTSACYSSKGVGEPPLLVAMGIPSGV